jgi:hypothetical protein
MAIVQDNFRVLRIKSLVGGFVADPDWVGNFDAEGARAVGWQTVAPVRTGQIQIVVAFGDGAGAQVAPGLGLVDCDLVAMGSGNPEGTAASAIYCYDTLNNVPATNVCPVPKILCGPLIMTCRIKQVINPPGSAAAVVVAICCG